MSIDPVSIDSDRYVGSTARPNGSSAAPASSRVSVSTPVGTRVSDSVENDFSPSSVTLSDELVDAIGLNLTRHNPVWTSSALDRIRELQHVLMKCAFGLPQEDRAPVLGGVKALELAVTLRLRFDEAMYAEQQAQLRRSASVEPNEMSNGGRTEATQSRAIAA